MLSEFLPNKYQSLQPVKHQSLLPIKCQSLLPYKYQSLLPIKYQHMFQMSIRSCFQMRIRAYSHSSIRTYSHSSITACSQSTVRSSFRYRRHSRSTLCTCHTTLARDAAPGPASLPWGCLHAAAGTSPARQPAGHRNVLSSTPPAG